jgi:hypothetical protein
MIRGHKTNEGRIARTILSNRELEKRGMSFKTFFGFIEAEDK